MTDENELFYLAILHGSMPIFELDFRNEDIGQDSTILAGFISALSNFSKDLCNEDLRFINQGNIVIGLEEGKNTSLFFLARLISSELQSKMRLLLRT